LAQAILAQVLLRFCYVSYPSFSTFFING